MHAGFYGTTAVTDAQVACRQLCTHRFKHVCMIMNYSTYARYGHYSTYTPLKPLALLPLRLHCAPQLIQQIRHAVWCSSRHILDGIGAGFAVVIASLTADVAVLQRRHGDGRSVEEVFRMRHPLLVSALSSGGSRGRREHTCEKVRGHMLCKLAQVRCMCGSD